jgi:hypothetical protein
MSAPITFVWTGHVMQPLYAYREACTQRFEIGNRYRLEEVDEPSAASRSHYFAALREAFSNLPHDCEHEFVSPEHLRKWALIKCGYANERRIVCADEGEACRVAAEFGSDFDVVTVEDRCLRVFEAQSQSKREMGHDRFEASKKAVLDLVAGLVGVAAGALSRNAGRAA